MPISSFSMQILNRRVSVWLRVLIFAASFAPLVCLTCAALDSQLGTEPFRAAILETEDWSLQFLIAALSVSPIRRLTQWHAVIRFLRMLGLFACFYGIVHFLMYVVF